MPKRLSPGSFSVTPSTFECLHLLGAEYTASILDHQPDLRKRYGGTLIFFAQREAINRGLINPQMQWAAVAKEAIEDVMASLPPEESAFVATDHLVSLDITPRKIRNIIRYANASIQYDTKDMTLDLEGQLINGGIIFNGETVEIAVNG